MKKKSNIITDANIPQIKKIKNISDVEFRVFSQWGEDGIIDWVINQIPNISKNFIEIGTEDYKEANTRFLLMNKNYFIGKLWKSFRTY